MFTHKFTAINADVSFIWQPTAIDAFLESIQIFR